MRPASGLMGGQPLPPPLRLGPAVPPFQLPGASPWPPAPHRADSPVRAQGGKLEVAYAPLEVVLKIKPRSNRDSRGWWGRERSARAGGLPLSARPKPSSSRVLPSLNGQPSLATPAGRAGSLGGAARVRTGAPARALALSSLCWGEWSHGPLTPHLPAAELAPRVLGGRFEGPPTPNPKGCAIPAAARQSQAAGSCGASVHSPTPLCWPRRPVPHARTRAPARCIHPYLRSGRGGGSPRETLRRSLEPQGLFQGAGGNWSRRAPRGARESSPRRAAERGGGPGAGVARRRICPARAHTGARGACAGVRPAAEVRVPRWVRSGGRASSSGCASGGGGEQGAGNLAVRPPLPSRRRRRRRRRGPCVQARSGEGREEGGGSGRGGGDAGGGAALRTGRRDPAREAAPPRGD